MGLYNWSRGSKKTTTILPTDTVVFVVGPSGSGKSRFMSILLQHENVHVRVSKAQRPGTTEVHAERCRFEGMQSDIVIVDTPSFCTYMGPDGEKVVRKWMESNYTEPCKVAMMLYMHNLAFNPEDANLRLSNHLGVFRRACRQNLFPSVIRVVPTLSTGARLSEERLRTLTTQLQCQANAVGAGLHNMFDGKPETAWDIVQTLLNVSAIGRWDTESSVTVRHMWGPSMLSCGPEKAMSISSRGLFDWFRGSRGTTGILPTDIVVFIVGPTGSGKSWFMSSLLKKANVHIPVSKSQRPGTTEVHADRCRFDGMQSDIVIVDTPSFCTYMDPDGEDVVREWVESYHAKPCKWAVILYMHDLASNPYDGNLRMSVHLDAFRRAYLPNPFPSVIHVVPTLSTGARLPKERLRTLTVQLQRRADAVGARLHSAFNGEPFDGKPETAWHIVQGLLNVSETGRWYAESSVTVRHPRKKSNRPVSAKAAAILLWAIIGLFGGLLATCKLVIVYCIRWGLFYLFCGSAKIISILLWGVVVFCQDILAACKLASCGSAKTMFILPKCQANDDGVQQSNMPPDEHPFGGKPETAWDVMLELLAGFELRTYPWLIQYGINYLKKPEVAENDYVIFVVGPTGAGKTRFTRQLSGNHDVGGHPGTKDVGAWRCNLGNGPANIIVIDTPSFHTGSDNIGADNTITNWLKSNFTERCHPGILFLHSLDSDPACDDTLMSRHLETFAKVFPSKFTIPSRVYVVPTSNSDSTLPSGKLSQRLLQLNTMTEALNGHGNCKWHASVFPGVFKGQPETAWSAALQLLKDTYLTQAKESLLLIGSASECLAPQFLNGLTLRDLASLLIKEFRKDPRNGDLDAIITFGRTAVEFTPPEHPQRYSALADLADLLSERLDKEGKERDLDEVITPRRDAWECSSPNDPQRLAAHLELDKSLSQRFRSRGALVDLEEIISLRRIVSEFTPAPDRYKPLLSLADSLHEKYQKLGSVDDIEEAIRLVRTASQLCPPEHPDLALSQEHLARYHRAKINKGIVPAHVNGLGTNPSGFGSFPIEQLIEDAVFETLENMPPRLLHTQSGELCNRDAQLSKFKNSPQYKRLLSLKSSPNNQQHEAEIKAAVSEYFAFATLSHRWGRSEPLLRDVEGKNIYDLCPAHGLEKHSLEKLKTFCTRAFERNFQWAWSDTCCIDKDSSAELQEAIGSMFSWYQQSSLTIVYLADVADTASGSLADSVWFKRGWTLQELLASKIVLFYVRDWSLYVKSDTANHKTNPALLEELCKATQIADRYLRNFNPGLEDARSRLCRASHRCTTRPEDVAYSLFGIFEVHLPVLYGETAQNALGRLLEVIISRSGDVSVLDWVGKQSSFNSCFPANLLPYRATPRTQLIPSGLAERKAPDLEKARDLYADLAELPLAQCVHRRIMLPSIIHPITAVTVIASSGSPSRYTYRILASRLTPLEVTSSIDLDEGAGKYILVRPWHPQSLQTRTGSHDDAIWSLVDQLGQPFNALLLERLLHNRYKRIACDCTITVCVRDLASILDSEVLTLEVV